ncbi:conserved protein of unknown function （contain B12-binding and Radical SAM domain&|uniref:B12-binding domain-containing radical SAM protein n=1 Tax=Magnetospirillum sp. XM-1 TaxID=1663591 RepID=UPI00073DE5A1|nr:radical SAM protein [Magnetospirillum sp. XM-1]CUW37972.1 conserved protein of unknown function \
MSKKDKVLLVLPNSRWHERRPWRIANNAAFVLTAILKHDFDFEILDANGEDLEMDQVRDRIRAISPDAVLVSAVSLEYSRQTHTTFALAREAKPGVLTVVGGPYASLMPKRVMQDPNITYCFLGHAEHRLDDFMKLALAGDEEGIRKTEGIAYRDEGTVRVVPPPCNVVQIKKKYGLDLTHPDYSAFDLTPYLDQEHIDFMANGPGKTFMLMSSRGCPHNCSFCANKITQGRGIAYYDPHRILEDIDYLIARYDINHLIFIDDLFLYDRERVEIIIRGIGERRKNNPKLTWHHANVSAWHLDPPLLALMRETGCSKIIISIESGSPRVLKELIRKPFKLDIVPKVVKMCRDAGMDIGANFVLGMPGETWEEIRQTFRFAEEMDIDLCHFHIATPQPGTDLYHMANDQGLLPPDFSFTDERFFGYGEGFIATDEFTPTELKVLRAYEWDRINFKTPEKCAKVAEMYMLSPAGLEEHRRQTRRKLGLHHNEDETGRNRIRA